MLELLIILRKIKIYIYIYIYVQHLNYNSIYQIYIFKLSIITAVIVLLNQINDCKEA